MSDPIEVVTDEPVAPGQYRHVATRAWWLCRLRTSPHDYAYLAENLLQRWVPASPDQDWLLTRQLTGRRRWLLGSAAEAEAANVEIPEPWPTGRWRAPHGDFSAPEQGRQPAPRPGRWSDPTPTFLAGLPRDAEGLYNRMLADCRPGQNPHDHVFSCARASLRSGIAPAEIRVAIYRVLSSLPGIALVEKSVNAAGRSGPAFAHDEDMHHTEIIINNVDGQYLGERRVLTRSFRGLEAGTTIEHTALTVATTGELPPEA